MCKKAMWCLVWGMALCLAACGGSTSSKSSAPEDGRVFFFNNTDSGVFRITFTDPNTMQTLEIEILAGETKELSQDVISGGTQVTLTIFFRHGGLYTPTEPELSFAVDGNTTVTGFAKGQDFFVRAGDQEIELVLWS